MRWRHVQECTWQSPLAFAAPFASHDMALLHTGLIEAGARHSFLLLEPLEVIEAAHWHELPNIPLDADATLPYFVGYLGYGLRCDDEKLTRGVCSPVTFPGALLIRYNRLFRFDHATQRINEFTMDAPAQDTATHIVTHSSANDFSPPQIAALKSNFTRKTYKDAVATTIERIHAGDFYQANITRKFWGEFSEAPDYFLLFETLCKLSPAPYAAYIRHGTRAIISSSPECFLSIDAHGNITSRPIKGSAARMPDAIHDVAIRDALQRSPKNLAENLMITDLIRHDLARVSTVGSVRVAEQSALHSYRTIHHLISTITAQKLPAETAYSVARACFAPGSMTGAPKIAAMRWCDEIEGVERGIYSGALGWFGGKNCCDLSVIIRTLVCDGARFEFQVGGGIVADSTPEDEWRETLAKARAIAQLLGISEATLEAM